MRHTGPGLPAAMRAAWVKRYRRQHGLQVVKDHSKGIRGIRIIYQGDNVSEQTELWRTLLKGDAQHCEDMATIRASNLDTLPEPWRTNSAMCALHWSLMADFGRQEAGDACAN